MVASLVLGVFPIVQPYSSGSALAACTGNAIVCENQNAGTPQTTWDISGSGDPTIQGFATDISYNKGDTVTFKISTPASGYAITIYRMGYYQGNGARQIAQVTPSAALPQTQPACKSDTTTGLVDCGNWAPSATWSIPTTAVSGIYFARLARTDTGGASHIHFIVRDDSSTSQLLFQTSDTTWQAYNQYGGNSLYTGSGPGSSGRAYKVSYNRPFATRGQGSGFGTSDFVWYAEYPMVRFLEANGYDISYFTDLDSDRRGTLIKNHKVFLSVGHDEYWSGNQRANVEAARDAGVNLAFFSGNEIFWKTRWENSTDGTNTAYRTLVTYKETHANAVIDPADPPTWTGTWRDPRFSPPADGGRPENALSGTIYMVDRGSTAISVSSDEGKLRLWRNTAAANLSPGSSLTLAQDTLGYEWDMDLDNGFRPAGLIDLSTTTLGVPAYVLDYGTNTGTGTATHHLTLYRAASGALVFSAGTVQWSWGLDPRHDVTPDAGSATPDLNMQQATINLLADMGAQPQSVQAGLVAATASSDTTPPTSTITSPATGANVPLGTPLTLTGTATDSGGGAVGGVEVSVDGGATWHPASGRQNWMYAWTPTTAATVTLLSRATDDSGNIQSSATGVTVHATGALACPCSLFSSTATPQVADANDSTPVELGVKFSSDTSGYITGIRFYKGATNTGTHVGSLWSSTGSLLSSATFTSESASGWQQVSFATPVQIEANTLYVASYHTNVGQYSLDSLALASSSVDKAPLHAPFSAAVGGNGLFAYGATTTFPNQSYNATNYWVDVVFSTTLTASPTTISNVATSNLASTSATVTWNTNNPASSQVMFGTTASYGSSTTLDSTLVSSHSQNLSGLSASTTYHYQVQSKDSGGTLVTSNDLTFTTPAAPSCPCSIWSSTATPATADANDSNAVELGVKFTSDTTGYITGIRFYKGTTNTGTHVGSLWTSTGSLLASATFTGETTSGWQQVSFSTPVQIQANTTYVASYHTNVGQYAVTGGAFTSAGVESPPLHALSTTAGNGNGVFIYGASAFPNQSFNGGNYWVDVVFSTN